VRTEILRFAHEDGRVDCVHVDKLGLVGYSAGEVEFGVRGWVISAREVLLRKRSKRNEWEFFIAIGVWSWVTRAFGNRCSNREERRVVAHDHAVHALATLVECDRVRVGVRGTSSGSGDDSPTSP